jgi:hypothetical protein
MERPGEPAHGIGAGLDAALGVTHAPQAAATSAQGLLHLGLETELPDPVTIVIVREGLPQDVFGADLADEAQRVGRHRAIGVLAFLLRGDVQPGKMIPVALQDQRPFLGHVADGQEGEPPLAAFGEHDLGLDVIQVHLGHLDQVLQGLEGLGVEEARRDENVVGHAVLHQHGTMAVQDQAAGGFQVDLLQEIGA